MLQWRKRKREREREREREEFKNYWRPEKNRSFLMTINNLNINMIIFTSFTFKIKLHQ